MCEVGVRAMGMIDFPLYEANPVVGYIPAANQSGRFMNRNAWSFNSLHMGAAEFAPGDGLDLLLVGDSIVFGGNAYAEGERLGPQLQEKLAGRVWPISAGSWALRNELTWVRTNPSVANKVTALVFVLNNGDFEEASSWNCELTHPRQRPTLALAYLFRKYVNAIGECSGETRPELKVPAGDLRRELADYLANNNGRTLFVLYPEAKDLASADAMRPYREFLQAAGVQHILEIGKDARWSAALYKDAIHPTPAGNSVLAEIIASALPRQ
jgi:hypothetical protein